MPGITVRDVPEEVRDELAARAARSGRSMQEYLRAELVELASRPEVDRVIGQIRRQARSYPSIDAENVLSDLDADRR